MQYDSFIVNKFAYKNEGGGGRGNKYIYNEKISYKTGVKIYCQTTACSRSHVHFSIVSIPRILDKT